VTRADAAGEQGNALLGLAGAWLELPEATRSGADKRLHGNPVICTQPVLDEAQVYADEHEARALEAMLEGGFLVVADDPKAAQARISSERPGYLNRAARRKLRRPRKP